MYQMPFAISIAVLAYAKVTRCFLVMYPTTGGRKRQITRLFVPKYDLLKKDIYKDIDH